jgi:hypothetical protein
MLSAENWMMILHPQMMKMCPQRHPSHAIDLLTKLCVTLARNTTQDSRAKAFVANALTYFWHGVIERCEFNI